MNAANTAAFPGFAGGQQGFQTWGGSQAQNPYPGQEPTSSPWAMPPATHVSYPVTGMPSPWQSTGSATHTPATTPSHYPAFGMAETPSMGAGQWTMGTFGVGDPAITPPDTPPGIGFGGMGTAGTGTAFGMSDPIAPGGFGAPSPGHHAAFPTTVLPTVTIADERVGRSRSKHKRRNSGGLSSRSKSRHQSDDMHQLTRSLSYSGGQPAYNAYRSSPQARKVPRPRDWRSSYKSSALSFLNPTSIGKTYSIVQEFRDDHTRQLNPLFEYVRNAPSIDLDLRQGPLDDPSSFPLLGHAPSQMDLYQYATNPPARQMRLFHKDLPWYIDIVAGPYGVVTAGDLLFQMNAQLAQGITDQHYYTEALTDSDRGQIQTAFGARVGGDVVRHQEGVLRVDFLGVKFMFRGLVKKNGMWEMKLSSP